MHIGIFVTFGVVALFGLYLTFSWGSSNNLYLRKISCAIPAVVLIALLVAISVMLLKFSDSMAKASCLVFFIGVSIMLIIWDIIENVIKCK